MISYFSSSFPSAFCRTEEHSGETGGIIRESGVIIGGFCDHPLSSMRGWSRLGPLLRPTTILAGTWSISGLFCSSCLKILGRRRILVHYCYSCFREIGCAPEMGWSPGISRVPGKGWTPGMDRAAGMGRLAVMGREGSAVWVSAVYYSIL